MADREKDIRAALDATRPKHHHYAAILIVFILIAVIFSVLFVLSGGDGNIVSEIFSLPSSSQPPPLPGGAGFP